MYHSLGSQQAEGEGKFMVQAGAESAWPSLWFLSQLTCLSGFHSDGLTDPPQVHFWVGVTPASRGAAEAPSVAVGVTLLQPCSWELGSQAQPGAGSQRPQRLRHSYLGWMEPGVAAATAGAAGLPGERASAGTV